MAKSGASSKIETGNISEVWTEVDEAEMQALLVRRNRVSIAMIGDSRAGGSMLDASKRRGFAEEDKSDYREWSLEYNLRKIQELLEPEK